MAQKQRTLYTIGYEGMALDAFIADLVSAGIEILIDIRARPISRKPGFSKNELAEALAANGISYLGLKELGTPTNGRDAAKNGQMAEFFRILDIQLASPAAMSEMDEAVKIAQSKRACLLCFEHDPRCCHRLVVASRMAEKSQQGICHLNAGNDLLF